MKGKFVNTNKQGFLFVCFVCNRNPMMEEIVHQSKTGKKKKKLEKKSVTLDVREFFHSISF